MSVGSLYDVYGEGVRALFGSAIIIKILFLIYGTCRTIPEICEMTGHVHAAVLAKERACEEYGVITRENEALTLTPLGTVIAGKIVSLYMGYDITPDKQTEGTFVPATAETKENTEMADIIPIPTSNIDEYYKQRMKGINLVFRSGIRTRILLELLNGATDRYVLREATGCGASHLRTNLRHLIDAGLIREQVDGICLTTQGKKIARKAEEIIPLTALIVRHNTFWKDHEPRNLPWFALESIGDLAESEIIHDNGKEYYKTYEHYMGIIASARHIHGITGMANPGVADAITRRVMEGYPGEIIVSPKLARYLFEEHYKDKVQFISTIPHFRFLVTEMPIPFCMTVTQAYLSMKMFLKGTDTFDFSNGFVSHAPAALAWGERVYAHYLQSAIPIDEYLKDHPVV